MPRLHWGLGVGIAVSTLPASVASAAPVYSYFYIAGQSTYNAVPVNSSIVVPLYLEEVSTNSTSLLSAEGGLYAGAVSVGRSGGSATILSIANNGGAPAAGFDSTTPIAATTTLAKLLESVNGLTGVAGTAPVGGISKVLLGQVTIRTGAVGGVTSIFSVGPYDSASGNSFSNANFYDLDNSSDSGNRAGSASLYFSAAATNFTVTTSAVPEPACAAVALTLPLVLRRRRRQV